MTCGRRNRWLVLAGTLAGALPGALCVALAGALAISFAVAAAQTPAGNSRPVDAALRDTLTQYASAFRSLDAAAVKRVQPSANVATLQTAFNEMRALDVSIDEITLLSEDQTATRVSCRVRQTLTPKAGSRKTIEVVRVVRLRKQNTNWVIDAFER